MNWYRWEIFLNGYPSVYQEMHHNCCLREGKVKKKKKVLDPYQVNGLTELIWNPFRVNGHDGSFALLNSLLKVFFVFGIYFFLNFIDVRLRYKRTRVHKVRQSATRQRTPAKDPFCVFLSCSNCDYFLLPVLRWFWCEMLCTCRPLYVCQIKGLLPELWTLQECLQNVRYTSLLLQCSQCHFGNQMKIFVGSSCSIRTGQQAARYCKDIGLRGQWSLVLYHQIFVLNPRLKG